MVIKFNRFALIVGKMEVEKDFLEVLSALFAENYYELNIKYIINIMLYIILIWFGNKNLDYIFVKVFFNYSFNFFIYGVFTFIPVFIQSIKIVMKLF